MVEIQEVRLVCVRFKDICDSNAIWTLFVSKFERREISKPIENAKQYFKEQIEQKCYVCHSKEIFYKFVGQRLILKLCERCFSNKQNLIIGASEIKAEHLRSLPHFVPFSTKLEKRIFIELNVTRQIGMCNRKLRIIRYRKEKQQRRIIKEEKKEEQLEEQKKLESLLTPSNLLDLETQSKVNKRVSELWKIFYENKKKNKGKSEYDKNLGLRFLIQAQKEIFNGQNEMKNEKKRKREIEVIVINSDEE